MTEIDLTTRYHKSELEEIFDRLNHLISDGNYEEAAKELINLHYADSADYLDNLNKKTYHLLLPHIAYDIKPELIVCLSDSSKADVLEVMGIEKSASLINQMDIEDAIEVMDAIDSTLRELLLDSIEIDKKQHILEGFNYPEHTVGRIVERSFVSMQEHWTCGQALDHIKRLSNVKDFYAIVIVDNKYSPVGCVPVSSIIKSDKQVMLSNLMSDGFKIVDTYTDIDEVIFIFKQYALTVVPVVNKTGRLIGTVSISNMIYIIEEHRENEFLQLGGVSFSDIFSNLYSMTIARFPWLFVNLIAAFLVSMIINEFTDTIARILSVAIIMPIVASMGGNAGTQAMTLTVRGLANREITNSNYKKIISKEILVCGINGLLMATIGALFVFTLFRSVPLSLVFACSVLINFVLAGALGSGIPILLNHLDVDPATSSGVFLTACTDSIGFFTFLGLSYYFLI